MITSALRLVGPPGSNKVMAGELSRLCRRAPGRVRLAEPKKAGPGALVYPFDMEVAQVAVDYCRTASRALWDLYESRASRLEPLYDELVADVAADERNWMWDGASLSIRARNVAGFAAGEMQVVGTIKNALIDGARARGVHLRVDPEAPDLLVAVRMHDDTLSVSIDLAGQALHQRGYRKSTGVAPLRENLAAVLVMLSRYDCKREVLLDPMAGSATIAIEAALMGRGEPLWAAALDPACYRMPPFAGQRPAVAPLFGDTQPLVIANELDPQTVAAARANVGAARVDSWVQVLHGDMLDLTRERVDTICRRAGRAGQGGVILSNPPYGTRLDASDPEPLYRALGDYCRQFEGWRAAFLVGNPAFERAFGGRPRIVKPLRNGSLSATFYLYDL